jgi:hypothetical protein
MFFILFPAVVSRRLSSNGLNVKSLEATLASNLLLQSDHPLLIASGVSRVTFQFPLQELVGIVGLEVLIQDTKTLSILGDLLPVTLDILEVLGEVCVRPFKYLGVDCGVRLGLDVDISLVCFGGRCEDMIGSTLDGSHELADLLRVLGHECVVYYWRISESVAYCIRNKQRGHTNVQDGAEAAAAQLSKLIDSEHLNIRARTSLSSKPFFQLNHLNILKTNASMDATFDDGL